MKAVLVALVASLCAGFRTRVALQLEVLALRHQLAVYHRRYPRARPHVADRVLWAWLSRVWAGWRDVLIFVQPSTVIAWQRRRFRDHWARLSRKAAGRPAVAKEVRDLIRKMSAANPGWGSPRIMGELAKLGIHVAKATVEKYMVRYRKPPSPTWRAFLDNHVKDLASVDFFVVPTVSLKVLFVFVVLAHARRRVVHFNVTEHPTAQWTAQQLSEAFPWEAPPRFLTRDRDRVYGPAFQARVGSMGIEEVVTAPRSPWQNPYAERVIGTIRRECLDHVVVLGERHLRRLLADYLEHYHRWRCHRSLEMDCPSPRPVQGREHGQVVEAEEAGGLYRHYERRAA
jgi:transposase InsO family protein